MLAAVGVLAFSFTLPMTRIAVRGLDPLTAAAGRAAVAAVPVAAVLPKEGSTAWSDTWMISSKAKHPNCMYLWMNHITSPETQAAVAGYFGEAPANLKACPLLPDGHCDEYGANDASFYQKLYFWDVPQKKCVDGRSVECVGFDKWVEAWTEIKG